MRTVQKLGVVLLLLAALLVVGCAESPEDVELETTPEKVVRETIVLNMCQTDPENADLWQGMNVNLLSGPAEYPIAAELPACSSLELEVLEKRTVDGVEFYRVRYGSMEGWQTKRLLTGNE